MSDHDPTSPPNPTARHDSAIARLDAWVEASPWHPRILPFFVYVAFMALIIAVADKALGLYPALYLLQCSLVVWLLWRYRRLTPELNWRFHWSALPTGLALCVVWIALGYAYNTVVHGDLNHRPITEDETFGPMRDASPALYWAALFFRLLGMSLVVPMFEEMFTRSAVMRGLSNARKTAIGIVQLLSDLPVIGDWLTHTAWGKKAGVKHGMFAQQLEATPLGKLTYFGVFASTLIFMLNHTRRDWAGCAACGLVWCVLLWWTNRPSLPAEKRKGLGPIIWSHAITNAALWAWTVFGDELPPHLGFGGDWQFL